MESLKALLLGGVAFETPPEAIHAVEAPVDHVFPLFADRETASAASYTREIPAISARSSENYRLDVRSNGALVVFGSVITIEPGVEAVAFCGVVILTMLAAETFDPRLMWDAAEREPTTMLANPRFAASD